MRNAIPAAATASEPLVSVEGLTKTYRPSRRSRQSSGVMAVNHVSFAISRGETLALVGETGCGKSTVARCVLRLIEPTDGRVEFDSLDLRKLTRRQLRQVRRRMQIVFQDPYSSLDPRMTVGAIVEEPLAIHHIGRKRERREQVAVTLDAVGIAPGLMRRKPHEFSGGQRQRIAIARALVMSPEFLVLDEPVSALDVSIQAQVLNLLRSLQTNLRLTYLFIVHDLAVARHLSHRVAVLYKGELVELASTAALFERPLHPYTVALLSAIPRVDPKSVRKDRRIVLRGEITAGEEPTGCPFRSRCPVGFDRDLCRNEAPPLVAGPSSHWVACHYGGELAPKEESRTTEYRTEERGTGGRGNQDGKSSVPE